MFLSELKELTYSIYKSLNIKRPIRKETPDFSEELKNLAILNNWISIDDWASNITQQILIDNGLSKVLYHYSIFEVPNILYPDQIYNILDMTLLPNKFWDKEGKYIKQILELYYKHHNNLPIDKELSSLGIRKGVKKYGGISKLAKELNLITYNSFKTIDGCIVRSRYEVIVSNFLYLNNIEYSYENYIADTKYLYDFKVGDSYVEVWGLLSDYYLDKRKLKEEVYKKNNLTLISIEGNDLNKCLIKVNEHLCKIFNINNIYDISRLSEYTTNIYEPKMDYISEMKQFMIQNNITIFPTRKFWRENGFDKHIGYFNRNRITFNDIKLLLDIPLSNNKPPKFWADINNVRSELQQIFDKYPNTKIDSIFLRKIGEAGLVSALKYGKYGYGGCSESNIRYLVFGTKY